MRKSVIYFFVALTVLSIGLAIIPNVVQGATSDIKIVSYAWYVDSSGLVDVIGEIQNTGSSIIEQVGITTEVATNIGTQDSSALAYVNNLLPNQKAPFYISVYIQNSQDPTGQSLSLPSVDSVALAVIKADTTTGYQYPDLAITSQTQIVNTSSDSRGSYMVSGTIKNTGSQTAQNVRILGTFYNSTGDVVAVGGYTSADPLTTSLAPSASVNFNFGAFDSNQTDAPASYKITSYSLLVQVTGPILLDGNAPKVTPYPVNPTNNPTSLTDDGTSPTATADTQATDQGNTNPSTGLPVWIYGVIVVVALAAVIGGVLALKKRKSNADSDSKDEKEEEKPKKPVKKPATKKPLPKKTNPKKTRLTPGPLKSQWGN